VALRARVFQEPLPPSFSLESVVGQVGQFRASGGREGVRTPGLPVANEAINLIRLGAATT
jgi:hypothetical protein